MPNNQVLEFGAILIMVQVLGMYMMIKYLGSFPSFQPLTNPQNPLAGLGFRV